SADGGHENDVSDGEPEARAQVCERRLREVVAADGQRRDAAEEKNPSDDGQRTVAFDQVLRDGDVCAVGESIEDEQQVADHRVARKICMRWIDEIDNATGRN